MEDKKRYMADNIVELSNQLTIKDMEELITLFSENISVYVGAISNSVISFDASYCHVDGHGLTIVTKSVDEYRDLLDDEFILEAVTNGIKERKKNKK